MLSCQFGVEIRLCAGHMHSICLVRQFVLFLSCSDMLDVAVWSENQVIYTPHAFNLFRGLFCLVALVWRQDLRLPPGNVHDLWSPMINQSSPVSLSISSALYQISKLTFVLKILRKLTFVLKILQNSSKHRTNFFEFFSIPFKSLKSFHIINMYSDVTGLCENSQNSPRSVQWNSIIGDTTFLRIRSLTCDIRSNNIHEKISPF